MQVPRSVFNRSHGYKTCFNVGDLVPFYVDEALPGDTFKAKIKMFARLNTLIYPIMDNLFLETFFFAVPNRLVWDHWENFCGEKATPTTTTEYFTPYITAPGGGFPENSIYDYMGIPPEKEEVAVSALYFRAYNLIYNEWFRDQNLQDPLPVENDSDGPDGYDNYNIVKRGKRHDYFTSCLPWPQKGDSVDIPLGSVAPIIGDGNSISFTDGLTNFGMAHDSGTITHAILDEAGDGVAVGTAVPGASPPAFNRAIGLPVSGSTGMVANLADATAATINSLRQAFQVQKMLERDARGGTRYTEIIRSHFGVISPDARLQRPEYLGGSSQRINIAQVTQTSSTDVNGYKGSLAAYGYVGTEAGFNKSFTEHSIIIGIVNVRADLTYQQGLDRKFFRLTRYDYYWPALAHLGEQPVYNREIFLSEDPEIDNDVFGYQERWAEYRYFPSKITGRMRSTASGTLDQWHLSEEFEGLPELNEEFIVDNTPISRALAASEEEQLKMDCIVDLRCARPIPVYSVPGLIDHF